MPGWFVTPAGRAERAALGAASVQAAPAVDDAANWSHRSDDDPSKRKRYLHERGIDRYSETSPYFKTTACEHFERGKCQFGTTCSYAHGAGDLRPHPALSHSMSG